MSTDTLTFTEATVRADGFDIRYRHAGTGWPLVFLHGAGGPELTPAHEILAHEFHVVLFEMPGFGDSPANTRHTTAKQLASTMHTAATHAVGGRYTLVGTSFGSRVASWLADLHADEVDGLVLLAPTGILPEYFTPPTPEMMRTGQAALYAHPDEVEASSRTMDAKTAAKQAELVGRLLTPRDDELEAAYRTSNVPTLLLFGTEDRRIPPSLARRYTELNQDFAVLFVYDAAHVLEQERPEATAEAISRFARHRLGFVVNRTDNRIFP